MVNWREEFRAALVARDAHEKANLELYDAYTKLADRTASQTTALPAPSTDPQSPTTATTTTTTTSGKKPTPTPTSTQEDLQSLLSATRADLTEAQKAREELANKLANVTAELERTRKKYGVEMRKATDLAAEKRMLAVRLRDRDEELRGKAKLLDSVQDELVSLNLQFNMAEERAKKIEKENKELVDRWMTRMGQEADAMNKASKFS